MKTINRADVEGWQRDPSFAAVRAEWERAPDVTIQLSGGTTADPLLWPRSRADLEDIYGRVARRFRDLTGADPLRVALVGGISHTRAALHWRSGAVEVRSFNRGDHTALESFSPDLLSCYPNIFRELFLGSIALSLPSLRAVKLGGERVFATDVRRFFRVRPEVPVIEQFGSTELPALAFRIHRGGEFRSRFDLESGRFDFLLDPDVDGWQALAARDRFPGLVYPLAHPYRTGDEALMSGGKVVDLRRIGDPSAPYWTLAEKLHARGAENVQLLPDEGVIRCTGRLSAPPDLADEPFTRIEVVSSLQFADGSNKLSLVLRSGNP